MVFRFRSVCVFAMFLGRLYKPVARKPLLTVYRARQVVNRIFGHFVTFWILALGPDNRNAKHFCFRFFWNGRSPGPRGCQADLFFGHPMENLERQVVTLDNIAGFIL